MLPIKQTPYDISPPIGTLYPMTVWGSIIVAVEWVGKDPRSRTRVAIYENIGGVEAFNVRITITGDSDYEIHPDAPVDKCRPRDAVLVMVNSAGTGVHRIDWTDAKGIDQGPVFRFPGP